MNKIDKFLYGGFAVALVGFIAIMLVSVFSPTKRPAEETAENPAIAQEGIADNNRINATAQHQNFEPPPPDYEALARILKAEEEAKRKAKEKAWWESRHDWVERFPFEPTHHPEVTFDPTDEEQRKMVKNHGFLKMFHNSRLPYTEEFEQLYDIVKEVAGEEKADNPFALGWTFEHLKDYHQAKAQDPETIYRKNAQVAIPRQPPPKIKKGIAETLTPEQYMAYRAFPERERRAMTAELRDSRQKELRAQLRAYHALTQYQTVDITWGERVEKLRKLICSDLCRYVQPDQPWITDEQALAIRDRLLDEIPAEGFLEMPR